MAIEASIRIGSTTASPWQLTAPDPVATSRNAGTHPVAVEPNRRYAQVPTGPGLILAPAPDAPDPDAAAIAESPEARFTASELVPHLAWVMSAYYPALEPERMQEVILASLQGLARLKPEVTVERDGNRIVIRDGATTQRFAMPSNAGSWANAAQRVAELVAGPVPSLAGARHDAVSDAFFSGLAGSLDGYSWYRNRAAAAEFARRMDHSKPEDDVQAEVVDGVGVLRIRTFTGAAVIGVRRALESWGLLPEGATPRVQGLVVDIIDDGGGASAAARSIADMFLRRGVIYRTESNETVNAVNEEADGRGIPEHIQVVVLQNGGTASAAEIFAGAVQENRRAIVLGTSSYGKSREQTVRRELPGGGALAISTALIRGPSGQTHEGQGVTPNACIIDTRVSMDAASRAELRRRGELDAGPDNPLHRFCPPLPSRAEVRTPGRRRMSDDEHRGLQLQAIALLRDQARYRSLLEGVELAPQPAFVRPRSAVPGVPWWAGPN
ncbi:MAG: S41 family peptidase [Myxococcota bacterium]|nr:S41 family peptidase [Myxococcota bacterium]